MAISLVSFGIVAGVVRFVLGPDLVAFLVAGCLGTAVFLVLVRARFTVLQLEALGAVLRRRQSR